MKKESLELNRDYADVVTRTVVDFKIETHRSCYENSPNGRERLQKEQSKEIINAVLAMWGDEPTIEDFKPPENPIKPKDGDGGMEKK